MKAVLAMALLFSVAASCAGSVDSDAAAGGGTAGRNGAAGGPDMTWCLRSYGVARSPEYAAALHDEAQVCAPDQICAVGGTFGANAFACCNPAVDADLRFFGVVDSGVLQRNGRLGRANWNS